MTISPDRPDFGDLNFGEGYFGGPVPVLIQTPSASTAPLLVLDYDAERASGNAHHRTLDHGAVVVLAPASLRSGTLNLLYLNEADAFAALNLHALAAILDLQVHGHPHWAMKYIVAPGGAAQLTRDKTSRNAWRVVVPFQEVAP